MLRRRGRRRSTPRNLHWEQAELELRAAGPDDAREIARLAQLDESAVPPGPLLLARVGGELWVAVSLATLEHVADPFRPSGDIAALALQRAHQVRGTNR
jgi:hypothetical protein